MAAISQRSIGRQRGTLLLGLVALLAGCASLETMEPNRCGNAVVDPGTPEDCDEHVPPAAGPDVRCGAPGTVHECRFECEPDGDPAECLPGWGCGADGICRRPSGQLRPASLSPWRLVNDTFSLGDMDGDGKLDALGHAGTRLGVRFGEPGLDFSPEVGTSTGVSLAAPWFADLTGDGRTDAVEAQVGGISTLLGRGDRTLGPVIHPAWPVESMRLLPVRSPASSDVAWVLDLDGENVSVHPIHASPSAGDTQPWPADCVPTAEAPRDLWARTQVAPLTDDDSESFALACVGASTVYVYRIREASGGRLELAAPEELSLLDGWKVCRGARLADVNGDGGRDLLVDVAKTVWHDAAGQWLLECEQPGLGISLLGPGPAPGDPPAFDAIIASFAPSVLLGQSCEQPDDNPADGSSPSWPLASGDLNGDGRDDFVLDSGIHLNIASSAVGQPLVLVGLRCSTFGWDLAEVVDLNRDGAADVVAGYSGLIGLDVLHGDGAGLFGTTRVHSLGYPIALRRGDFNGDATMDAAVVEYGLGATEEYRLSLLLGGGTLPSTVEPVGPLGLPSEVEPGHVRFEPLVPRDLATDLLVLGSPPGHDEDDAWVTLLMGGSPRMSAPHRLLHPDLDSSGPEYLVPLMVAPGHFFSQDEPGSDGRAPDSVLAVALALRAGRPLHAAALPLGADGTVTGQWPATTALTTVGIDDPDAFDVYCNLSATGPIGAGGREVMVAVDRMPSCYDSGACASPSDCPPRLAWFDVAPEPAAEGSGHLVDVALTTLGGADHAGDPLSGVVAVEIADVDLDGAPDLVVTYMGAYAGDEIATRCEDGVAWSPGAGLAVYWGEGDPTTFDWQSPAVLTELPCSLPADGIDPATGLPLWLVPFAAARIEADADGDSELVLLTSKGAYLIDVAGRALSAAREPTEPSTVLRWTTGLAVADLDRDGLDDVVFGTPDDVNVLLGVPCGPGGPGSGCVPE